MGKLESTFSDTIIDRNTNDICELKQLRNQNSNTTIIGYLDINSKRSKFESLVRFVGNNLDILMALETKIDDTFPASQFLVIGFSKPFRIDCTAKSGGIFLYIREDITYKCKKKKKHFKQFIRGVFCRIKLEKQKMATWILI